jgi:glycosyltransferase involved in cell wall biosynthesis
MLFSIIIPTFNSVISLQLVAERLTQISLFCPDDFEVIICDDSDSDFYVNNKETIAQIIFPLNSLPNLKVRYQYTAQFDINGRKDYGLARARNIGITLASGDFLIFLDHRLLPSNYSSLRLLIDACNSDEKIWAYGSKGFVKDQAEFVENFSCIKKYEIVRAGMFMERVNIYGGMTLELKLRFAKQGFKFVNVPAALANISVYSGSRQSKDASIPIAQDFVKKLYYKAALAFFIFFSDCTSYILIL